MDVIKKAIRDIPDFPKKGIIFKDITPVLNNPELFRKTIDILHERYEGEKIDKVVGVESRGFIFGAVLAYTLGAGFTIVRKVGKLPYKTIKKSYDLEYGTDHLEMHEDSILKGERVLIIDDLLATGGTCEATAHLVEQLGGKVQSCAFVIELTFLKGKERLKKYDVFSMIQY
ncbi:MAG: adenine phosphoribosyltransferase [Deltaproteobacteria bacterium RIFCSPHIGHO2_02_FULL_40_11]|nr:MAG: adenine phosphoribosyltransferase [Deltaproteobacteria bacterium RIFCSPHIGHO2_02_FULL_40_11]